MMKSMLVKTLVAGISVLVAESALGQQTVRYVDMAKVFQGYYKTISAEKDLKKQEELYQGRAKELAEEAEQLKEQGSTLQEQALNVALSENARQRSRQEAREVEQQFNAKQHELRQFLNEKQQELRQKYISLRNDLSAELVESVQNHATENKVDVVFDVSGMTNNMLPVVLHYPKDQEITEVILKQVNKGHEDELPKPEETTD